MSKNTMKLLWLLFILSFVASYQAVLSGVHLSQQVRYLYYYAALVGFLAWLYVSLRVFLFKRQLARFIRRMAANEYEAGIKTSPVFNDDVTELSGQINKMADQLVLYDGLQRDRISVMTRALDIVYHAVNDGIILFDISAKEFRFNPAVQRIFAVEQETMAYEAIALQTGNREFMEILRLSIEKGDIIPPLPVRIVLPVRQTQRDLVIRITPIKDNNESVVFAIIFVSPAG